VERHGGTIRVVQGNLGGARFEARFPETPSNR
jgi:signal transduction histidine kinase